MESNLERSLVLYGDNGFISPWFFSTFVAITEKGVPHEIKTVDIDKGETHQEPFNRLSPTEKIPMLLYGDQAISESIAICDFLENQFPAPKFSRLFPSHPMDRARCMMLLSFLRTDLGSLREDRPTTSMFFERVTTPLRETTQKSITHFFSVLERMIPSRLALFGEWCIADSEVSFLLYRLILNGDPVPVKLRDYAKLHWNRPSTKLFVSRIR